MPAVASSHTGLTTPASADRVNSNVRPHQTPFMSAAVHFGTQRQHTEYGTESPLPPAWKSGAIGSRPAKLDLIEVSELQTAKDDQHHRGGNSIASFTEARTNYKSPLACARRASHSEPLVHRAPRNGGVPPLLCRLPGRGGFRGAPKEAANFASVRRVWPNSSFNPDPLRQAL